jgi:hypothetical protein
LVRVLAAAEAVALLVPLASYIADPPGNAGSGGPQMGLFFFVLVPMFVLAIAVALLVFGRRSRILTGIGGAIVLFPVVGFAYWGVEEVRINRGVAELDSGRGYFTGEPARSLGVAICGAICRRSSG